MIIKEIIAKVLKEARKDQDGREMTYNELGFKASISRISALHILHTYSLKKFKLIWMSQILISGLESYIEWIL